MIRLFNVDTLQLAEFPDQNVPQYAILSHRWIPGQELTFNDLNRHLSESTNLLGRKRAGALKLKGACIVARTHGLHWIWIDSCCIDKSNNSELSEAINSMYSWYKHAKICLTYLFDVVLTDSKKTFENSIWFHRCWTLQELIAPHDVEFYDVNWELIGTKLSLRKSIYDVTGIDMKVLNGGDIDAIPVGCRMSWMSSRTSSGVVTSRAATCVEDEAYSLLGIFGVNMPLLYGEKRNAFRRLQEAILETINDPSIFAWDSISITECHEKLGKFRSLQNWDGEKRKLLARDLGDFQTQLPWLSNSIGVADSPSPLITICDKLPNDLAVLNAVLGEFVVLIKNSATLAMILQHCALEGDKKESELAKELTEQVQVLARHLEHEAQDRHCLSTARLLHLHATDVAKEVVRCAVHPKYLDLYAHIDTPNQPDKALSFSNPTPEGKEPQEHIEAIARHLGYCEPGHYGCNAYLDMPHKPKGGLSFAHPSIFVASSRSYTLFAQELIDTWRSHLWSHSRLRELLEQRMPGGKNQHKRNKNFLQFIELEFDLPIDTPKLMNSQTISGMDRLWHIYELLFGSRASRLQSLQSGEVHISWKSVSPSPLAQILEKQRLTCPRLCGVCPRQSWHQKNFKMSSSGSVVKS
jgi:hypothetical protein